MVVEGYDLDLSYITSRLLAMSFPAQNMEAIIRNPMWQVQRALDIRYDSHYKVYNLCEEAVYDPENFHGRVEWIPFDDNHVPPLFLIKIFCESVRQWLDEDPANVAVIHCRAGKGRTGLMVCAYLVYEGMSAEAALQLYATQRTYNNEGVTIASQRRYVGYWSRVLKFPNGMEAGGPEVHLPTPKARELRQIRLYETVNTDTVQFVIHELQEVPGQLYVPAVQIASGLCKTLQQGLYRTLSPRYYLSFLPRDGDERNGNESHPRWVVQMDTEKPVVHKKACLDYYFDKPLVRHSASSTPIEGPVASKFGYHTRRPKAGQDVFKFASSYFVMWDEFDPRHFLQVAGDIRAKFFDKSGGRLFYACFNTFFIANSIIQLGRGDLDKVGKRAKAICGSGFCLELLFGPTNHSNSVPVADNSF